MGTTGKNANETKEHRYTIHDLINRLGSVEEAVRRPTPKQLREKAGEPVLKSRDGSVTVFSNGYAVFRTEAGGTVLWVPGCRSFTYHFTRLLDSEKEYQREDEEIPENTFLEFPWEVALNLIGLHRVEFNMEMRIRAKADRITKEDVGDSQEENEEGHYRRSYHWRDEQLCGNPETEYIRQETQREVLDRLTDEQKEAFVLYFRDGLTQQEIADELKISHQSVYRLLEKALKKVKKIL